MNKGKVDVPGMEILRIFPHLRIFLGSQCMTLNGHISIKR